MPAQVGRPDRICRFWLASSSGRLQTGARAHWVFKIAGAEADVEVVEAVAVQTMSGFTLVLASLKMWLEHGIEGDLMYDRFPDAAYSDR